MHIHLSCARSPIAVPHCLLRACAGRPGLSPSTTPGLRKALDFGELTSDPLIRGIQQKYIKNLVDFDALLKEAKSKGELAQMIQETFVHDRSILNPPERDRTYSSTKDNDAPGTGSSRSMLNSPQAWSAETAEQATEWMQIYAGGATAVFGVRIQPRVQYDEKVKAFTVQYSADDFMWSDVDGGAIFTGTSGNFDALFAMPVTAQYIRITVQGFVKWPSMRAGLLVHLTTEEKEAKDAEAWTEALNKMLPPPMDWKWPTAHGVDCKDYHPRIGGGKEVVGGYTRGYYLLANVWWWCGKEVGRGTMLSAVALSLLWLLLGGVLQQPTLTYGLSVLLTTAALCALTYAFWVGGETRMADASESGANFGAGYDSAQSTARVGYALCGFTVAYLGLALALLRVVLPSLPLVQCACRLIGTAPGAIVGALLSVLGQGGLLAFWFAGATYICSSGLLEFNEHGFARLTYSSDLKQMAAFHFLGGLWTSAIVAHLGKIMAANALGHAYWRAAERKLERGAPPPHHWLLCPLLHIGSVALGATASLLSPLLLPLQLCGLLTFNHFSESGYIAVSLFGANLSEANRWASAITHGFLPVVLRMQAHCAVFTFVAKMCVASTCACVAALVLGVDASFKDDVSSLCLPVAIVFIVSYVLAATLLSLIDLAVAAGVQGWCLDYKQNCVDQRFKSAETWMMAMELVDEAALLDLHEFLSSEREQEHQVEGKRGRTARAPAQGRAPSRFAALFAAAPQEPPKKSKAQLRAEEEAAEEPRARDRKKGLKPTAEGGAKGKQGKETDTGKDTKKKAVLPAKEKSPAKGKTGRAPTSDDEYDDDDDDGRERPAASPSARRRRAAAAEDDGSPKKAASRERSGEMEDARATTSTRRRADS